jgi:hypothetical protein
MGDALKASKTKTYELLVALKKLESKELQTSKKADMQKTLYDAFEKQAIEGEVEYMFALEKSLTMGVEV